MLGNIPQALLIRFGPYELNLDQGELRKNGIPVKLQRQPFKVLTLLAGNAGQVISKDDIRQHLWGNETFVDVEKGVSFCIRQARAALGDTAKTSRFIETLPRRGYRFIAPVERQEKAKRNGLAKRQAAGEIAIAVLPFTVISEDPQQDYFADGMTEALITELAHISAIRVISRTSVMQYKAAKKPLPEIARELNVDAVVEGAVLRSGKRVRIAAQLIDSATDRHIWAESYDRELRDILALQSDVARAIAGQIEVKITPEEHQRLATRRLVNPDAFEAYLKGVYFWNKRTEVALRRSIEFYERAIEMDPTYAQAYAGLADSYSTLAFYETVSAPPREAFAKAKTAAIKAVQLDNSLAEAHAALGIVKWAYDWDTVGADRHFARSVILNGNYATAHHWYALCLGATQRFDESLREITRARTLDPLSLSINTSVALCLYWSRRYDAALEQAQRTLEIEPNYMMAHTVLGLVYEQKGMLEPAIRELRKAVSLSRYSPMTEAALGHAYAASGCRQGAQQLLDQLKELSRRRHVSPIALALLLLGLGDHQQAVVFLHKAFEERSGWLVYVDVDPRLACLRSDPAFRSFRRGLKPAA